MVAEKSDTAVYSVTIIVCTLIGFALGYYNNQKEKDKMIRNTNLMFYTGMALILGVCIALMIDYLDVVEKYQIEEQMEEEEKENELTLE
jgi:hypothetical protein